MEEVQGPDRERLEQDRGRDERIGNSLVGKSPPEADQPSAEKASEAKSRTEPCSVLVLGSIKS